MAVNNVISSGFLVFLDQLVFGVAGWIYWLIISKYASTFEIGQSTAVYSLILLISTFTQLGLQYPMLNRSSAQRYQILGSVLLIELTITLVTIPIVIYLFTYVYPESLRTFASLGIGILFLLSISFVGHFVLLGISEAKKVLILDTIATIIKFVTGLALVATGFGASGILLSFLIQGIVISFISLVLAIRIFGCKVGNMNYLKEILRDGLVNVPSQLSGLLIFSLSVVLLASFGVPNSNIGVFYISLMISFVVGSFVSSMALMLIPWASKSNTDMSIATTRIGISLSAPIIAVLISSPKLILSFVGPEYLSGETILVILSVSILPFAVMINSISKFNFTNDPKKIILIGATQLMVFLITFFLLVPKYGILGAAISILIAFIASSIPSVVWSDRLIIKYIINTCIAILVGSTMGYVVASVDAGGSLFHIASVILSVSVTFALVIVLGNTSRSEITQMIKTIVKI